MTESFSEEWWVAGITAGVILLFFAVHYFSSATGPLDPPLASKVVDVTLIKDSSCTECLDVMKLVEEIRGKGVTIGKVTQKEVNESSEIITQYAISKVPTLIFSIELGEYQEIRDSWQNFGSVEEDGMYIYRNVLPLFREVTSGKVRGNVDLIHIRDATCESCLDTNVLKESLTVFGVKFAKETTLDVINASTILNKYKITQVPTIILSKEMDAYPKFFLKWDQYGSVEEDGSYVFRNLSTIPNSVFVTLNATS